MNNTTATSKGVRPDGEPSLSPIDEPILQFHPMAYSTAPQWSSCPACLGACHSCSSPALRARSFHESDVRGMYAGRSQIAVHTDSRRRARCICCYHEVMEVAHPMPNADTGPRSHLPRDTGIIAPQRLKAVNAAFGSFGSTGTPPLPVNLSIPRVDDR